MNCKKWKQRSLAVILAVIMALGGINIPLQDVYAAQEFDFGGGVTGVLEDGSLTVSKTDPNETGRMNDFAENESPVTNETVNKLRIGDGVELIGSHAFENTNLESVTISESVYGIGDYAFHNNKLESVIIPASVKKITEESFSDNRPLELIIISEGVETIGRRAFASCSWDLKSLTVPESVYKIDSAAFARNYSIKKITIGSDVEIADDEGEGWSTNGTTGQKIGFKNVYDAGGKQEGTYIYKNNEWEKTTTHTVSYNHNGSTKPVISSFTEYFTQDEEVMVWGNAWNLAKSGYVFTGWNTEADGSGTIYGVNDSFKMGTKNIILYANWSKNTLSGDGSAENPYEINTREDLLLVSKMVNYDNKEYGNKHYKLINDVDLAGKQWTPIGEEDENSFKGIFDGNNKKIVNLSIGTEENYNTEFENIGLFGYIDGATIKNLDILEVSIYAKNNNEDDVYIGGLAGYVSWRDKSRINNVTVSGEISCDNVNRIDAGGLAGRVSEGDIDNSKAQVKISGGKGNIGGFIGEFSGEGKVDNCQATGSVKAIGDDSNVGGFIGINGVTILNSFATGDVIASGENSSVAGFAGINQGSQDTIINSYARGRVIGGNNSNIGGFVGENKKLIINCYAVGNTQGGAGSFVGGFAGINIGKEYGEKGELAYTYNNENSTPIAIGCIEDYSIVKKSFPIAEDQMKSVLGEEGSLVDILNNNRANKDRYYWNRTNERIERNGGELIQWSEWENFKEAEGIPENEWNYWTVSPDENKGFPVFGKPKQFDLKGQGTLKIPYEIYTREDLELLTMVVNEGYEEYIDKHYKLMNDIDLADEAWTPIGKIRMEDGLDVKAFKGVFDGNNKEITNLFVGTRENYNVEINIIGLFGAIDGATIKDLDLNVSIYSKYKAGLRNPKVVAGLVGGILGEDKSYIYNVEVAGTIDIKEDIRDIKEDTGERQVRQSGAVPVFAGGVVGGAENVDIKDSKSMVDINSDNAIIGGFAGLISPISKIDDCQANGNIASKGDGAVLGGFIGRNLGTILNSFATVDVSVTGAYSKAGGFAGINEGSGDTIINSYARGNISGGNNCAVGGFVGENSKLIINSYASGAVEGGTDSHVGGFAGKNVGVRGNSGKLNYTYNNKNITTISIGDMKTVGVVENSFPVPEVQMKAARGQDDALMDILNNNRKLENQENEWKEWAVIPGMNEGFPTFAEMAPKDDTSTSNGKGGSGSKPSNPESPVIVIVNGKEENAGKETRKEENGKKVIEVVAKPVVMKAKIEEALRNKKDGEENFVEVPVSDTTAEITRVALTGEIVKKMENHDFTFSVDKKNIRYNIPAKEFAIEAVAKKLEVDVKQLSEIEVELEISMVSDEARKKYEKIAKERINEIVVAPVEFNIEARVKTIGGSTEKTNISRFNSYVERVIEIPEGIDPSKITTGIVFNQDGSYSHVPTEVFKKKGKYYAKLNSLTNSTYSVVWNPVTVDAVKGHWSQVAVNDMASRLVVSEVKDFVPDKAINRAEFANYIVRALGLYREEFEFSKERKMFLDVKKSDPSFTGISIASELGIVNGYPDGTFRPDDEITREEAMKMYAKAMDIVKLVQVDENRISSYEDKSQVAPWAYEAVRKTLGAGVFNGREGDKIAPKGTLTCAEAATAIRNLLIESGLINK